MKKYCECFQAGIPCKPICKCIGCKNQDTIVKRFLGDDSLKPNKINYAEADRDAVIIGDAYTAHIPRKSSSGHNELNNPYLEILNQGNPDLGKPNENVRPEGTHSVDPHQSENVASNESKNGSKIQIDNDFLSILKSEIPTLRFTQMQITKDDLMSNAEPTSHVPESVSNENVKASASFYNILGLSNRHRSQFS